MQNVSFKGAYAIPNNDYQNPGQRNYIKLLTCTAPLKDPYQASRYDKDKDIYYVYVRDEYDTRFEDYASRYGIIYHKAKLEDLAVAEPISPSNTKAAEAMLFLHGAINMGAKNEIRDKGDTKEVILYNTDKKTIFAKFYIDKNTGKLVKKIEYLDGKTDCVHEYDDNGNYKKSVINGENTQLEFTYDKDGKPIMKKNF
ncbi:hypothetical protein IJS77_01845 [bacterium]|nr:hypothetical protein [bacterium]